MTPVGDPAPGSSPPPGRNRWLRRALALASFAYLAAVLAVWLGLRWADRWWPSKILLFSPRWVFALPLAVLGPAGLLARSWSVVPLLAAAAVVAWPVMGFNFPWARLADPDPAGVPFRVMTLNMHGAHNDPRPFEQLVKYYAPDVVAVQEWQGAGRSALKADHGWYTHSTPWLFLASRHPIRQAVVIGDDSMGPHGSAAHYELETPVGTVHVFSVHLASARDAIADALRRKPKGSAEVEANSARRREQSVNLAGKAAECGGPVLVLGDFNTPPESPIFPEVWGGYTNAFTAAGWGWGYTFLADRTTVRIDHVLAGGRWNVTRCRVGPPVGSPHRPVLADLAWSGPIPPR